MTTSQIKQKPKLPAAHITLKFKSGESGKDKNIHNLDKGKSVKKMSVPKDKVKKISGKKLSSKKGKVTKTTHVKKVASKSKNQKKVKVQHLLGNSRSKKTTPKKGKVIKKTHVKKVASKSKNQKKVNVQHLLGNSRFVNAKIPVPSKNSGKFPKKITVKKPDTHVKTDKKFVSKQKDTKVKLPAHKEKPKPKVRDTTHLVLKGVKTNKKDKSFGVEDTPDKTKTMPEPKSDVKAIKKSTKTTKSGSVKKTGVKITLKKPVSKAKIGGKITVHRPDVEVNGKPKTFVPKHKDTKERVSAEDLKPKPKAKDTTHIVLKGVKKDTKGDKEGEAESPGRENKKLPEPKANIEKVEVNEDAVKPKQRPSNGKFKLNMTKGSNGVHHEESEVKVSAEDMKRVAGLDVLKVPMKTYHARNVKVQETMEKLDTDRNTAVAAGDKVDSEVGVLVTKAQNELKRLDKAEKTAVETSKKGKSVSSLWVRIVDGTNGKVETTRGKALHVTVRSRVNKNAPKVAKPMKMPKALKFSAKSRVPKNAPKKSKGGKLGAKVSVKSHKNVATKNKKSDSDKSISKEMADLDKLLKEDVSERRLQNKSPQVENASKGLDMMKPVNKLKSDLVVARKELSNQTTNIQSAHDQAKVNNTQAGKLLGEEQVSMKEVEAANAVVAEQQKNTAKIRKDKADNFKPLPKEALDVK